MYARIPTQHTHTHVCDSHTTCPFCLCVHALFMLISHMGQTHPHSAPSPLPLRAPHLPLHCPGRLAGAPHLIIEALQEARLLHQGLHVGLQVRFPQVGAVHVLVVRRGGGVRVWEEAHGGKVAVPPSEVAQVGLPPALPLDLSTHLL